MAACPEISIIVCTHDRARALERCLSAVARQRAGFAFETIIVDNASTDDTRAVVDDVSRRLQGTRYVFEALIGLSRARNRGAGEARAPILAYLDDDAEPVGGWLEALHSAFADTDAAVVGGPIVARFETPAPEWLIGQVSRLSCQDFGPERRVIDFEPYLFGANFAVRAKDLRDAGGFDPLLGRSGDRLFANEETDVCERLLAAGRPLLYEPAAAVFHWIAPERISRHHLRRRALDTGRSVGLRLRRRLGGAALARSLALKAIKLPVHAAIWSIATLLAQRETIVARERSIFVTAGIFTDVVSSRRAPAVRETAAEQIAERENRARARARG